MPRDFIPHNQFVLTIGAIFRHWQHPFLKSLRTLKTLRTLRLRTKCWSRLLEGGGLARREPPAAARRGAKKREPRGRQLPVFPRGPALQVGDDLLSRFRSTIGAAGFNFSVRDG